MDYYNDRLATKSIKACHRIVTSIGKPLFLTSTSVIDYGCGTGLILKHIRQSFPTIRTIGLEISEPNLDVCRASNIECYNTGDLTGLNLKANVVICTEVLEHVLSPQEIMFNLNSLLPSGGHLICTVPNAFHLKHRLYYLLGRHLDPNKDATKMRVPEHIQSFGFSHFEALLQLGGFQAETWWGYLKPCQFLSRRTPLKSLWSSYVIVIARKV